MARMLKHRIRSYRPTLESLEVRRVLATSLIEVHTGDGYRTMDGALVPTLTPEVRITLPAELLGKNVRVLLDDHDPKTPKKNITDQFALLDIVGTAISTLDLGLGGHTIEVRSRGQSDVASMLNFDDSTLVVSSPLNHEFKRDKQSDLTYETETLLLNFLDGIPLDVISEFLHREGLVPLDYAQPLGLVRVEIPRSESPLALSQRLMSQNNPYLEGAIPNIVFTSDSVDTEAESLPRRLLHNYQAGDGGFDDQGTDSENELRIFRYHFLMDTFAGHRLVETLDGTTPSKRVALAVIDSGLGTIANPNAADIPVDAIIGPSGITTREPALSIGTRGEQITHNGMPITLAEIEDLGGSNNQGHGTRVAAAAASRGNTSLGTGPHVLVRPIRPLLALSVNDNSINGPVVASAAYGLLASARDPDVFVVNTSFGEFATNGNAFLQAQIDGVNRNMARVLKDAGKIWVAAAGNNATNLERKPYFPANLAPGPDPRGPGDYLVMAVSATGTMSAIQGPERLWFKDNGSGSNFGPRISVAAPGDDVILPKRNGVLEKTSGTSFAAPAVAGLAAEMIYADRNLNTKDLSKVLSPLQIIEMIEATADDLGSRANNGARPNNLPGNGRDDLFGHGRINVWKSILGVANRGIAVSSAEFPSLSGINDTETNWYGFKVRTNVRGATAWIDGEPLTDEGASLPNLPNVTAYAGVQPHSESPEGVVIADPGTVPVGNAGGEHVMTFSIHRDQLKRTEGRQLRVLSLRSGKSVSDAPFFNLPLDLPAMRLGRVAGVSFDDFVFEVTPADFGDSPDNPGDPSDYSTLLIYDAIGQVSGNGARHLNSNLEWLGSTNARQSVSAEVNANDASDPDGVPNTFTSQDASYSDLDRGDDGVRFFPLTYVTGARDGKLQFTVSVANRLIGRVDDRGGRYTLAADQALYVNAWIDWDGDKIYEEDNNEHVVDGFKINPANDFASSDNISGQTSFVRTNLQGNTATFEATFRVGKIFAGSITSGPITSGTIHSRVRLDYGENVGRNDPVPLFRRDPTLNLAQGAARFGEVEDYPISVDFGDAPDPTAVGSYPTLRAQNGARHLDTTKEWIGASVTREFDAAGSSSDQDRTPNLGSDGKGGNLDDSDESSVSYDVISRILKVSFAVTTTIKARGFDHPNGAVVKTLSDKNGDPSTIDVKLPITPGASRGKGRYNGLEDTNRIYVNIWSDWNGNGSWDDAGEYLLKDAPVAPETFGRDEMYTLGERFTDKNGNGVYEQDVDVFSQEDDIAGISSRIFNLNFSSPLFPPLATKFYVRVRLTYGEPVTGPVVLANAHSDEPGAKPKVTGRTLSGPRGGALFGEVEDHPIEIKGKIDGKKWQDFIVNGVQDRGEPGLDGWIIELYEKTGDRFDLKASQTTRSIDLDGDGVFAEATEVGLYSFTDLAPGIYVVTERKTDHPWSQEYPKAATVGAIPLPAELTLKLFPFGHLVALGAGDSVAGKEFGNAPPCAVTCGGKSTPRSLPIDESTQAPPVSGAVPSYIPVAHQQRDQTGPERTYGIDPVRENKLPSGYSANTQALATDAVLMADVINRRRRSLRLAASGNGALAFDLEETMAILVVDRDLHKPVV